MIWSDLILELESRENAMLNEWQRVIPRAELLNDRWEKARLLNFDSGVSIYDSSFVFGSVEVGEKTWVGPYTILDGTGKLKIGKYCNVSAGVQIYTHSSLEWVLTGGAAEYSYAETIIGDCVYLGSQCIVDKGVSIGGHSIVAANSYVNHSFPEYSVIGGTPAKLIGHVKIDELGKVSIEFINK